MREKLFVTSRMLRYSQQAAYWLTMPNTRKPSSEQKKILIGKANKRRWAERRMLERLKADYVTRVGFQKASTAGDDAFWEYTQKRSDFRVGRFAAKVRAEFERAKRQAEAKSGTPMISHYEVLLWIKSVVKLQAP
jgi:hypothetical protein